MRSLGLLLILAEFASLHARSLPIRSYAANIIPLAITQDREGLLWLATPGGIVRFDGLHFEPLRAPAGIDLASATRLAATADGSVWIGTGKGLLRYRDGKFTMELPGRIGALLVTRAGRLLAALEQRQDLHICFQPAQQPARWSVFQAGVGGQFHEDLEGKVWFGCSTFICSWTDANLQAGAAGTSWARLPRLQPGERGSSPRRPQDWYDVVATPDQRVWARRDPDLMTVENQLIVSWFELPAQTFEGLHPGLFLDRRGALWIPGRKLNVVESGASRPIPISAPPLDEDDVTAIFQDRQGTLWFGLAGKGLVAMSDEAALETWSDAEGISGSVLDLAQHPRLGVIAATDAGGYAFDPSQRRWHELPDSAAGLRSVTAAADGAVMELPYRGGLLRGSREISLPAGIQGRRLRRLYRDPRGVIWIGTIDGLLKIDPAGRVIRVALPGDTTYASDMAADAEGQLWVGHLGGVSRCHAESCTQVIAVKDGLLDAKIRTIATGPGEVWVGYRASIGFSRFEQRQGGWIATHFNPADGFGPSDTHFLRRDRRGWIWRGSTDGVYVSDGKHVEPEDWIHLTFGDRINSSYANQYGFLEAADGSVWIGTQVGAVRVHPSADWFQAARPRMAPMAAMLRDRDDLAIRLSRPGLSPFQSRLFRYRLLPVDSRWRMSSEGAIRYAKLRAGDYRLQIGSGGGNPPAEYAFRVQSAARLWRWVWISLVLAAVGGGLAWARKRRQDRLAQSYWDEKRRFLEARDEPEDWSGRTLDGRFALESRIASGGFAAVYRASDQENPAMPVAVKLLHPLRDEEQWRRRRFAAEVAALRELDHSGIVRILHAGDAAPDQPYLVMEFIDGITLRELLGAGRLEFDRAARLLRQTGEALAAAHRSSILHRDLKPENVMVCDAGSAEERIKLIDFGIARTEAAEGGTHSTRLAGSPGYLAPERWIGLESCASDVYSMAAIAWEMLTGESYQHGVERPPAGLPQAVADLLRAALAYDPADRPQDAEVFAREVEQALSPAGRHGD